MLLVNNILICPFCNQHEIETNGKYFMCRCGEKLISPISKKILMAKINVVLNWHSFSCSNLFPRVIPCYSEKNTKYNDIDNLTLKCSECDFNEQIL